MPKCAQQYDHEETSETHVESVVPTYEKSVLFKVVRDMRIRERLMRLRKPDDTWKLNAVSCIIKR